MASRRRRRSRSTGREIFETLPQMKQRPRKTFKKLPQRHRAVFKAIKRDTGAEGGQDVSRVAKAIGRPRVRARRFEDLSVGISRNGRRAGGVPNTGEAGRDKTVTGGPRVRVYGPASSRAVSGGTPRTSKRVRKARSLGAKARRNY